MAIQIITSLIMESVAIMASIINGQHIIRSILWHTYYGKK